MFDKKIGLYIKETIFFTSFFPNTMGFLGDQQSSPITGILCMGIILANICNYKYNKYLIALLACISGYFILSFFRNSFTDVGKMLINYISEITPVFAFFYFYKHTNSAVFKIFRAAVVAWLIISAMQFFGILSFLEGSPIHQFFKLIFGYRFSFSFDLSSRGVSGFASEPSDAALVIILMLCQLLIFHYKNSITRSQLVATMLMIIMLSFFNRSGTLLFFLLLIMVLLFLNVKIYWKVLLFSLTLIVISYLSVLSSDIRILQIFQIIKNQDVDFVTLLIILGGARLILWSLGFIGLMKSPFFLGWGSYSWRNITVIKQIYNSINVDISQLPINESDRDGMMAFEQTKPYSYFSMMSFEYGIIGFLILSLFFISLFRNLKKVRFYLSLKEYRILYICFAISFCCLFLFSLIPNPLTWIILAQIFVLIKKSKFNENIN